MLLWPSVPLTQPQQELHASRLSRWRAALATPALLLLIYIGFYWKLTLTRQYTWLESPDFANQVLPWYQFQAGEWHKGRFPIWDPHEWGGQSLIGQAQPGVAYPPNWILFLLPLRNGWMRLAFLNWYIVLIRYMGGLFCYLLCRDLKRSRPASLLAGAAFGITGWMGSTDWPQMLNGAVWAPLVFLFLLRVIRGQRTLINGALAGASLGVAFLSGHHQIPIYISLAAGGLWLYAFFSLRDTRRQILQAAALFAVFLFCTSALQMLPAWEYGKLSVRWVGANEPIGWNTPVPYSVHTNYSFYPSNLIGMILPAIARNANAYVTFTLVALAFLAVAGGWRDRTVRIIAAVTLGGLIFAFGAYSVFHGILYSIVPMVEKARSASFAIFIFHFGVIVLSAYAADAYLTFSEFWVRRAIWTVLLTSVAVLLMMLLLDMTHIPKALDLDRIAAAAFYGLLLAALLGAWRHGHIAPTTGIALALMLIMAQAGLETGFAWPNKEKPSEYLKKMSENSDIVEFIRKQPRFVRLELDDQEIPYNFNDWQGIDTFNGYLASLTSNIARIQGDYRVRMLFGANLWIGKKPLRENQRELFTGSSGLKVYANPEAFPQTWIVHAAVAPGSFEKYDLAQLRRLTFLRHGTPPKLEQCNSTSEWSEVTRRDPQTVWIDAQLACAGMVILGDASYPGWTATIDGRTTQLYEAYEALRGVVAPAGRHHIEFRYRPMSVYLGALLTLLGLCGAGFLLRRAPSD
jgi:hypothetical protein